MVNRLCSIPFILKECSSTRAKSFVRIGNVCMKVHSPKSPYLVPTGFKIDGNDQRLLSHLKWLLQKNVLKQDIFLIGTPGSLRSTLIFQYLELCNREYEYLSLTRDTTEADLKQRREIRNGSVYYADLCAVRAALNGRVLILDGVEKAERNVLPILNSLLESREMPLDDGRFLIPAEKYDSLVKKLGDQTVKDKKLERVSEEFFVIALGLPVPSFQGYALDPPFRSRFQCRNITSYSFEEILKKCLKSAPNVDAEKLKSFVSLCFALNSREPQSVPLQRFPVEHLLQLSLLWNADPSLSAKEIFAMGYPYETIVKNSSQEQVVQKFMAKFLKGKKDLLSFFPLLTLSSSKSKKEGAALKSINTGKTEEENPSTVAKYFDIKYVENEAHEQLLMRMMLSHQIGDFCVLGEEGNGKTTIVSEFARRIKCFMSIITLYKDMNSRDLLQERRVLPSGDTVWQDSELVSCAKDGQLCVLDGIDRVHWSFIEILAPLIQHRRIDLFDGTRLVSSEEFDNLKRVSGMTEMELEQKRVFRIHPSFRILAIGSSKKDSRWLNEQINALFLFHTLPALTDQIQCSIVSTLIPQSDRTTTAQLVHFVSNLKKSANSDIREVAASLSLRKLIHIVKRITFGNRNDIHGELRQAVLSDFLPFLTRETFEKCLSKAFPAITKNTAKTSAKIEMEKLLLKNSKYSTTPDKTLVPNVLFYDNKEHLSLMENMASDIKLGFHILLMGNQGVGKNKVTDRFLQLLDLPRQYLQLHRDTTVQSLTTRSSVVDGKLIMEDSPLVKAVKEGHILVIDEADKAPLHVVAVLKTLLDVGIMRLADGRVIMPVASFTPKNAITLHSDFKIIMLANRPGFPFLGNNLFSVLGDLFSVHVVNNPSPESELQILKKYAPDADDKILIKLCSAFNQLRDLATDGRLSYPYSIRELVNIAKHLQNFPRDGINCALQNVFDFDQFSDESFKTISEVFQQNGIPFGKTLLNPGIRVAEYRSIPELELVSEWHLSKDSENRRLDYEEYHLVSCQKLQSLAKPVKVEHRDMRTSFFSEQEHFCQLMFDAGEFCCDMTTNGSLVAIATSSPPSVVLLKDLSAVEGNRIDLSHIFSELRANMFLRLKLKFLSETEVLVHEEVTNFLLKLDFISGVVERFTHDSASLASPMVDRFLHPGFDGEKFWRMKRTPFIMFEKAANKVKFLDLENGLVKILRLPSKWRVTDVFLLDSQTHVLLLEPGSKLALLHLAHVNTLWNLIFEPNICFGKLRSVKLSDTFSDNSYLISSEQFYAAVATKLSNSSGKLLASNREQCSYLSKAPFLESIQFEDSQLHSLLLDDRLFVNALPLWKTPSRVFKKGSSASVSSTSGFLEVINLSNLEVFYLPVPTHRSDACFGYTGLASLYSFLVAASNNGSVLTCDIGGGIRKWQLSQSSLDAALTSWKKMFGTANGDLRLEHSKNDFDFEKLGDPKIGKFDPENTPHVGGNTWAGGTGGYDTAGLGGFGGPFRLDAGHDVHQLSQSAKDAIPEEILKKAKEIAEAEYKKRLREIEMGEHDAIAYQKLYSKIQKQVILLRSVIDSLEAREEERQWERHHTSGDLDEAKLVESIVGEKNVYRRRVTKKAELGSSLKKPKRIRFCFDISGSMYRFNGHDGRLQRSIESALLVMEALHGKENKIKYDIVGHSGQGGNLNLVSANKAPHNEKQKMDVLKKMIAHTQFCVSGDSTLETISSSTKDLAKELADERFIVVISDANLERYGIRPEKVAEMIAAKSDVNTFLIFIGSLGRQAARLQAALPSGRAFVCENTSQLPQIMQNIFTSVLSK